MRRSPPGRSALEEMGRALAGAEGSRNAAASWRQARVTLARDRRIEGAGAGGDAARRSGWSSASGSCARFGTSCEVRSRARRRGPAGAVGAGGGPGDGAAAGARPGDEDAAARAARRGRADARGSASWRGIRARCGARLIESLRGGDRCGSAPSATRRTTGGAGGLERPPRARPTRGAVRRAGRGGGGPVERLLAAGGLRGRGGGDRRDLGGLGEAVHARAGPRWR